MPTDENLGEGTSGEPNRAAEGSRSDAELLSTLDESAPEPKAPVPDPDADFLKKLESYDPAKLPQNVRSKFEAPFLSDYTRKTQALAERERNLVDRLVNKLGGAEAPPDERAALLDRVKNGDWDVLDQYLKKEIGSVVDPLRQQLAASQAVEAARLRHPLVKEKEREVFAAIAQNEELSRAATSNNFAALPLVMEGVAIAMERDGLKARNTELEAKFAAIEKGKTDAQSARVRGLPPQTSRAGVAPSGTPNKGGMTPRQAMIAALEEQGVEIEPWLRETA